MSDANIPGVDDKVQQSLNERWMAGRASDEAVERRLGASAEAPEKKRLWDRLNDVKKRIAEMMAVFSGAQPANDANLERRYGQGMTEAERAEDAALVAQAEREREQAVAHLEEVVLLDQPRRPAGETPVHKAYSAHADKRAPAYEVAADAQEAVMWEAEAAAKELDPALRLTSETYNGRRVARFTHAEFPEVTWLMPVEAMSTEDARNYLENNLHRTYNEKMAKIEAQAITLPRKPAPKPAESPIVQAGEAAEQPANGDLQLETEMEQRLELARDVREGRIPADDLEPGQEKWIGDLLDDAAFNEEERRLAILKEQRAPHAAEPADPADRPKLPPKLDVQPPAPGSRPPGVPTTPPAPEEKLPGIPPPPPGEVVRLSSVMPARKKREAAPVAPPVKPVPTVAEAPIAAAPETPAREKEKPEQADWRPIVGKAGKAYDAAWSAIRTQITEMIRLDPANIERVREMYEDAQNIEEEKILKELVGLKMIDQKEAEAVRGSDALDPLATLYIKLYKDALSEAEHLDAAASKPSEATPAAKDAAHAEPKPAEPAEKKRRIDVTSLVGVVDFLTKRWAFLASNNRPNTKVGDSIDKLIDDMGGEETPEGQAFKAYVDATAELHKKGYAGATDDELKPFADTARKAFVTFRNLVEPPKPTKKPRGQGKPRSGPQPPATP